MKSQVLWLKTKLANFREFFWPLLETEPESNEPTEPTTFQRAKEIYISNENLEKAFELTSKIYEAEDDRRKSIESKASLFISTISITTSIVVASNALITGSNDNNLSIKVSVFISFILSIYTVRTVWFSVKALEKGNYHLLGFEDINVKGNKNEYFKYILKNLNDKTEANYKTINTKVDNLTMAQAYYKRAIVIICLYALLILVFCFFFKKSSKPAEEFKSKFVYKSSILINKKIQSGL